MSVPSIQTAFAAGEIAPSLYGHCDLAKYHIAAATMRNMLVNYRGGAMSRAGTAFVARSKQAGAAAAPRLIRFQFNINQGYALEFGDHYMRVHSNGAPVLESAIAITGATQANPCQVTATNSYANGDWVVISGVVGMTQLNGHTYIVSGATGTHFTLTDLNGNNINSTAFGAYTSGGQVQRVYTLATPYAAADLPYLKYTQSADVMSLTCVNQVTGAEYPPYDLTRINAANWTLTQLTFAAVISPPASISGSATVNPSGSSTPPTKPTAYAYVVTSVSAVSGEESIASPIANVTNSVDIASTAGSLIINWAPVTGAAYYNVYKAPASYNTNTGSSTDAYPVPVGAIFGYIGQSYGTQFVDSNVTADLTQVPPLHKNPFAPGAILYVTMTANGTGYTNATASITTSTGSGFVGQCVITGGVLTIVILNGGQNYSPSDTLVITGDGSGAAGTLVVGPTSGVYPGCVAYYQQRRVYAASTLSPDTYWMSKPGLFKNFDSSVPVTDADAITGTPWAQQVNGVQFMIPMPGGLVTLTGLGAWQVTGSGGSAQNPVPITPSSQQAQPQAYNGCSATVPPFAVNYDILYVQAKGSIVRDLAYNYWANIYTGTDLTQLSSQLFTNYTIREWAWCEEPYKVAWLVRDDGTMLSLTYLKEQEVFGWARHDTNGLFVSVCSVTEPPVDALYAVVQRFPADTGVGGAGNYYYIERMDNRIWNSVEDPWCVDAGLSNTAIEPSAYLGISAATGTVTLSASAASFNSGMVGNVVRADGGIITLTGYTNSTTMTGIVDLALTATIPNAPGNPPMIAAPGDWSISAPITTVTGLNHLIGLQVSGLADGVPIPFTTVSNTGAITLATAASDVKVGLPFAAQLQSVYLDPASQPTMQARRKDITAVTVRVNASLGFSVGTNQPDGAAQSPMQIAPAWSGMLPGIPDAWQTSTYTSPGGATVTELFTGDIRVNVGPNWSKPGQIAVQQLAPWPLEVTALIPELLSGDLPEETYQQQQQPQGRGQREPRGPGAWMLRG
jgi:hypothetical protein